MADFKSLDACRRRHSESEYYSTRIVDMEGSVKIPDTDGNVYIAEGELFQVRLGNKSGHKSLAEIFFNGSRVASYVIEKDACVFVEQTTTDTPPQRFILLKELQIDVDFESLIYEDNDECFHHFNINLKKLDPSKNPRCALPETTVNRSFNPPSKIRGKLLPIKSYAQLQKERITASLFGNALEARIDMGTVS